MGRMALSGVVVKLSELGLNPGDVITGFVSGTSQTTDPVGVGVAATALYDQMPDSLTFASNYTLPLTGLCSAPGFVSRRTHASSGDFDVLLPSPAGGVEPRRPNANNGYTLVFASDRLLDVPVAAGATVVSGMATAGAPVLGPNPNQVTVELSNVPDLQNVVVSLNGVKDSTGANLGPQSARLGVLVGDTNQDRFVNGGDAIQTRNRAGQITAQSNFLSDVNVDGFVNGGDTIIVRGRSGGTIPAAPTTEVKKSR